MGIFTPPQRQPMFILELRRQINTQYANPRVVWLSPTPKQEQLLLEKWLFPGRLVGLAAIQVRKGNLNFAGISQKIYLV